MEYASRSLSQISGQLAEAARATGGVRAEEVLAIRGAVWGAGELTRDKIEAVLAINLAVDQPNQEWTDFLAEAVTVWLVDLAQPQGYVEASAAEWLVAQLAAAKRAASTAELELLVKIEEKAVQTPACLRDFALRAFEEAVNHAGRIDQPMARRLRRLIFAEGGDSPGHVSQREAELLFRLKDLTVSADNAAEWKQLFVQGVGNFLQGCQNVAAPNRDRAQELERFMSASGPFTPGEGRRLRAGGLAGQIRDAAALLRDGHDHFGADLAAAAAADARLTPEKDGWLHAEEHGAAPGDEYEAALQTFLQQG